MVIWKTVNFESSRCFDTVPAAREDAWRHFSRSTTATTQRIADARRHRNSPRSYRNQMAKFRNRWGGRRQACQTRREYCLGSTDGRSGLGQSRRSSHVHDISALPPTAAELVRCSETTRCATSGSAIVIPEVRPYACHLQSDCALPGSGKARISVCVRWSCLGTIAPVP